MKRLIVVPFILFAQASWSQKKQTVGDLLKKVQDESRGGGARGQVMQKASSALPEAQYQFQQNKQKVDLDTVKPPKSSEILKTEFNGDQRAYEKLLDRQIQEAYKLTKKFANSNSRGELWLRLAELYVEKASLVDNRKQDEYDSQLKAFQAGQSRSKPKLDLIEARNYNRKAIQLYEWFQRDFSNDPKMSQALFFLGYNYFELGDTQKGSFFYEKLTKDYPDSPFVGEAKFALAEFYFENEKWADAYREYSFLIQERRHRLHTFALYKGAWCLYRLGKTKQAIKYLDFIIKSGRKEMGDMAALKKQVNRSRLENEAARDMVVFYADIGEPEKSLAYFKTLVSPKEAVNYVEKLAYFYNDKGNKEASKNVFRLLIEEDPTVSKAFEYQYQIVQNYFYSKNSPEFKEEVYRWIREYGPTSSWYAKNSGNKEFIANAYKLQEQTLRNYTLQQHQTAQNSRAPYSQQQASEAYKIYIQEFADSTNIGDMHFLNAELLYDMGKYDEASTHYQWVIDNAPTNKYYAKAGQNLLLSIEKTMPKDEDLQKRIGDSVEPMQMEPQVEKFVKTAQWYVDKFPKSEKDLEIRFRIGRLYYLNNHFDQATTIFKDIIKRYPKTKQAEYSANLLLDVYNLRKDYAGLEKVGTELLSVDSISSSKAGSDIRGVMEKSSFKRGQDLEMEKKYKESAEQFENFAKQNPKSNLAIPAIFNAGVNFERAGILIGAVANYNTVMASKNPEAEKLKPKTRKLLAKLNQDAGNFEEAARLYKVAAEENMKDPLAPNYIFNAAVMYEALGRNDEAVKNYRDFIRVNKKFGENVEALFSIAQIHRKAGQSSQAVAAYKEYIQANPSSMEKVIESHYWISALSKSLGRPTDQQLYKNKTLALQKRAAPGKKGVGATYAAKLKLENARETYLQFASIRIPADPAKQKGALDRKFEFIAQLNRELADVVKYDTAEEIVGALNLIGEMNYHMGSSILNAPFPAGLSEAAKAKYKEGIEKVAAPFMAKAKESFRLALDRGSELDVYNDAYRNSFDQMSKLDPQSSSYGGEMASDSRLMNWMVPQ